MCVCVVCAGVVVGVGVVVIVRVVVGVRVCAGVSYSNAQGVAEGLVRECEGCLHASRTDPSARTHTHTHTMLPCAPLKADRLSWAAEGGAGGDDSPADWEDPDNDDDGSPFSGASVK